MGNTFVEGSFGGRNFEEGFGEIILGKLENEIEVKYLKSDNSRKEFRGTNYENEFGDGHLGGNLGK